MQAHDSLVLYKRHSSDCDVHKSRIPVNRRRYWMECKCPIWIVGRTPNGDLVPRQSTGECDLKRAEAVKASLIVKGQDRKANGPLIEECIQRYLASRRDELSDKTLGQHELVLGRLKAYCDARGVLYMGDLSVDILETFKIDGLPGLASTSKATAIAKLRCFLKDAYRRDWIPDPLVEKLKPHRAVYEQKSPYTDDEVTKILNEALKLKGGTHAYAKHPKTFRLLLELMLETGMRVGDAIRFDPKALTMGEVMWIHTYFPCKHKRDQKPKPIEAYLTDRLKIAIDTCEWLSPALPFAYGSSKNPAYLANEVYYRMQTIGGRCGVNDCRPHRLRDTFAVRKLLGGLHLEDVSRLLGHSSVKVTEMYYAKWIASRKRRLERVLAESLVNA